MKADEKQSKGETMKKFRLSILVGFIVLFSTNAFSGWIFSEKSEGEIQMTYVQNNNIKFVQPEQVTIFRLNENILTFINPKEKTYWSGTPEQFVQSIDEVMAMTEKHLNEQLGNLPPEQRDALQKTLKSQFRKQSSAPVKVDIRQTDETDTIIGYPVRKYEIRINGQLSQEQWIANSIQISREFKPDLYRKFLTSLRTDFFQNEPTMLPEVADLLNKGWPLKRTDYDEDGYPETEETIKAEQSSIPASAFDIPSNYRRISLTEMYR
jgi:hypothetical protein